MTRRVSNNTAIDTDKLPETNQRDSDQSALPANQPAYKTVDGMESYRASEGAALNNMHRLRIERLAREASTPPAAPRARKIRQK
jgi:hypothetical protein